MAAEILRWAGLFGSTGTILPQLALRSEPRPVLHRWSIATLRRLGVEVELRGAPALDAPLWIANHLSWLDPLVMMSLRPMGTVAKGEVAGYPLIGRWARKGGLRFVERDSALSRAAALAAFTGDLRKGRRMLLFPEGTTTRGERLAPFYEGGLLAAHALDLPVQPLRIASPAPNYPWTGDEALLPHITALFRRGRTPVEVHAGPLLRPADFPDAQAFLDALRDALLPETR